MQNSKALAFTFLQSTLAIPDEIPHHHCFCYHCINNTKPLPYILAPRITSDKQKRLSNSNAYQLVLKELVKGFTGKCQVPDVYFLARAELVYMSSNGRPKLKQDQTNIEVKKHFEEQRRKNASFQMLPSSIINLSQLQVTSPNIIGKLSKQIAIMSFHDGTQQVLADIMLSKILQKRKNDPFWEGISHILLIPSEIKHPFTKISHQFIRSNDTLPYLQPIMEKIAKEVDKIEQNLLTGKTRSQSKQYEDFLQIEGSINPQSKFMKTMSNRSKIFSNQQSVSFYGYSNTAEILKHICFEIVAHIEVASFTRILKADFQFFTDGNKYYLCSISNFICDQLENNQLTLIHDRYKPFQEISLKQIASTKKNLNNIQAKQLWRICSALVNQSLEFRKVELKLINYKKPNQQTLLKIFMKIFPDFRPQKIFGSINWKNQLDDFVNQTRSEINKIIREDEGIRILRRFGIQFRRTFH